MRGELLVSEPHAADELTTVDPDRHLYGDADAPIRIVEYADFQCPHCRAAAPELRAAVEGSEGQVSVVFRHFPLFTIHPFALTAALAAEASGEHFWEMHDLLLARQDRMTDADLTAYGRQIGVRDVVAAPAQAFRPAVQADYRMGVAAGVRGTPALFIGGELYRGRVQRDALQTAWQHLD